MHLPSCRDNLHAWCNGSRPRTAMPAPKDITRLVEQFERNADAYRSPGYNETQVRREFIDPFFKCLGRRGSTLCLLIAWTLSQPAIAQKANVDRLNDRPGTVIGLVESKTESRWHTGPLGFSHGSRHSNRVGLAVQPRKAVLGVGDAQRTVPRFTGCTDRVLSLPAILRSATCSWKQRFGSLTLALGRRWKTQPAFSSWPTRLPRLSSAN